MINVTMISIGSLKEDYLKKACDEYAKRLGSYCKFTHKELKEKKTPDKPSSNEISQVLEQEALNIIQAIPAKSYKIALCVEGKQMSSEQLAQKISQVSHISSDICFIIGSSHGLSEKIKKSCDLQLSISEMTFPHQLIRVMLFEIIYRSFSIIAGTKYHK